MTLSLPIDAVLPQLCRSLANHNRCLLVAQPGAGKTTRAPLALLESSDATGGKWLLLEPRRAAARLAADFMAKSLNEKVGETVGYRVRGESKVGRETRLEVVTQGILTRILQDDPFLDGIQGIIFDEFHERSLDADLGLALALEVQASLRDDLKLLVMSATLDVDSLLAIMGGQTPVINCPGRSHPVAIAHRAAAARDRPEDHWTRVVREALADNDGDILVFLPGQREINRLHDRLAPILAADIQLCRLHGRLTLARQRQVLRPERDEGRRVILSTDVAESSVTVPGVRTVVDAGRERVPVYHPRSGLTRLETRQVNRASADQRAGRAGREAPGTCYRLWSDELPLVAHREPEILQADLAGLAYELLRWGVSDPAQLSWVTPVPAPAFAGALALLRRLQLVDSSDNLTERGRRCGRWPTHPRLAVLLEQASARGLESLACWLVAWLEENLVAGDIDIIAQLHRVAGAGADNQKELARWRDAARQWSRRLGCALTAPEADAAAELLAIAYPDRLAENRGGGRFRLAGGGQAVVPEHQPLARAPFLVITDLDGRSGGARVFSAVAIRPWEIEALFPESLAWRPASRWDEDNGRLVNEEVRGVDAVALARRPAGKPDPETVRTALLEAVRRRGYLKWSDEDRQLLGRLRLLHDALGESWQAFAEEALLAEMEQWLAPHLDGVNRLDRLDALPLGQFLLHTLPWPQQQSLNELAPTHYQAPSGSRIRIDYSGDEPVLAVKLQEMFGETETPLVAGGRRPLTLHLLSPARRPVQVTRDLANFWQTTYFDVRRDLKGRYPRHPWPDDPLAAPPTRYTKNRRR